MSKDNKTIVGVFVKKEKILSFLEELRNKAGISFDSAFVFLIGENGKEYLVTYKTNRREKQFKNATVMHSKGNCFFTINGLNKLIDENRDKIGKDMQVDWSKYEGTLITSVNDNLKMSKLTKIEDKTSLFLS